jgi:hypothetical protein
MAAERRDESAPHKEIADAKRRDEGFFSVVWGGKEKKENCAAGALLPRDECESWVSNYKHWL